MKAVFWGVGWDYVTKNVFNWTWFGNQIIDCISINHSKGHNTAKQESVTILGVFGQNGNLHSYTKVIIKKIFGSFRETKPKAP